MREDPTIDIDMCVVDTVADDWEAFPHILEQLNQEDDGIRQPGWWIVRGRKFTEAEVTLALIRMVKRGWVQVALESESEPIITDIPQGTLPPRVSDAWYCMSPQGRMVHSTWKPEHVPEDWT
jgi:hypothetical protein